MPVADKPFSIILEESQFERTVTEVFDRNTEDSSEFLSCLIEEILDLISGIEKYDREDKDNKGKIEMLQNYLVEVKRSITKAEDKRDLLGNVNSTLKSRVEQKQQEIEDAANAWHETFGITVEQISRDNDDFEHYEFQYTKLPKPIRLQRLLQEHIQQTDNNTSTNNLTTNIGDLSLNQKNFRYKVGLKHHNSTLTIVSQEPEILRPEEITSFNEHLTKACICPEDSRVDYKLAVLKIKQAVVKNP